MTWTDRLAPSLDDFAALGKAAFDALPDGFRQLAGDVVIRVDDFPDEEVLDSLGIQDPFELTGLYQGVDLSQRSVLDFATQPSRVFLYRRPILDEWAERGDVSLGELITHVLVHELGTDSSVISAALPSADLSALIAPSLDLFSDIARRSLEGLPAVIQAAVSGSRIVVEEFGDAELLSSLGIEDPFELSGVYEGVDLPRRSLLDTTSMPSTIRLFRRPILDEWFENGDELGDLIDHVLIHEVAHHFGFSDLDIERIEAS